jgi:hypothetical protein
MPADWNIKFLILDPGQLRTGFEKTGRKAFPSHSAYQDPSSPSRQLESYMLHSAEQFEALKASASITAGVVNVILNQEERPLPLRLPLGVDSYGMIKAKLAEREKSMDERKDVTYSTMPGEQANTVETLVKAMTS